MTSPTKPKKPWWFHQLLADNADEDLLLMSEAASILGVSTQTLRRMKDDKDVKAPSKEFRRKKFLVYLYTPDDIRELKVYFGRHAQDRN